MSEIPKGYIIVHASAWQELVQYKLRCQELSATVEALNSKNFELTCYRVDVLRCLKTIAFEHNHADVPLYQPMARQLMDSISANAELKKVRAEAGRAGYLQGHLDAMGDPDEIDKEHATYRANQYADSILKGEVE